MLLWKFKLGLFDDPYVDPAEAGRVVGSDANAKLALQAARETITLLKNEKNLAPLDASKIKDGKPELVWQKDGTKVRYASPIIHEGRLYVADETGNLNCLNARTGDTHWRYLYSKGSEGSPVLADGKIYIGLDVLICLWNDGGVPAWVMSLDAWVIPLADAPQCPIVSGDGHLNWRNPLPSLWTSQSVLWNSKPGSINEKTISLPCGDHDPPEAQHGAIVRVPVPLTLRTSRPVSSHPLKWK